MGAGRRQREGFGRQRAGPNSRGLITASAERKPPDVTLVVHHREERGVAGRRALDQTDLTRAVAAVISSSNTSATGAALRPQVRCPPFRPTRLSTQLISTLQDYRIHRGCGCLDTNPSRVSFGGVHRPAECGRTVKMIVPSVLGESDGGRLVGARIGSVCPHGSSFRVAP
jgi:hypothetical protein